MASPLTRSLLKRLLLLPSPPPSAAAALFSHSSISRNLSTSTESRSQKLGHIADELISLNKLERYDYSILLRLRLGLTNSAPSLSSLDPSAAATPGSAPGADAKAAEKTVFDVKLDKFDAATKIKVIKEVRAFTELGLKEAKDLVEKAPIVVKKGVSKEEGEAIIEKLKTLGATVVLE